MEVVIVNGNQEADFIIKMFLKRKDKIIVINSDKRKCEYLSATNKIKVINGSPTKLYDLTISGIENADIFVALSANDIDNYVACKMAKTIFNVKKCIAIVSNPKNVEIFKQLGIDSAISSTYLLAESIQSESNVENLIRTLSLEDDIIISELIVLKKYFIVGKSLAELSFPNNVNISCIYRKPNIIIPNGSTVINENDKLVIITAKENQKQLINYLQRSSNSGK